MLKHLLQFKNGIPTLRIQTQKRPVNCPHAFLHWGHDLVILQGADDPHLIQSNFLAWEALLSLILGLLHLLGHNPPVKPIQYRRCCNSMRQCSVHRAAVDERGQNFILDSLLPQGNSLTSFLWRASSPDNAFTANKCVETANIAVND